MSVDNIATRYLNRMATPMPKAKPVETVKLESHHTTENVIIARTKEPRYYAGSVGKGERQRAVWVHDIKQARHVDGYLIHLYEDHLGEDLTSLWPYA